ncbi:MAG: hypothetical protein SFU56_16390 [Capsulimonadales bacterium]|nr:hypothetical protein [Capsulimonadales bacterium]
MNRFLATAACMASMTAVIGGTAAAQAQMVNAPIPTRRVPDVQVVAFPLPTREWAVTTVYPKTVPRTRAESRVRTLLRLTGWRASEPEFKDRALEPSAPDAPKTPVMSSVTFRTTGNVVNLSDGTMPLEPFARAFRDLDRVHITYLIPGDKFAFRGIREYSDNNLEVSLSQGQGAFTYMLNIKNHNLESLRLPTYETIKSDQGSETAAGRTDPPGLPKGWIGTGLAVAVALGAGTVAYLLFTRMTAR